MDANPEGTTKTPDLKDGAKPDAAGGNDGAKKDGSNEKTYSAAELQAESDRRVNQALETAHKKWQADQETARAQAAKEAEEKKLQEQGEFQKLLEAREAELAELRKKHEAATPWEGRAKKAEDALKVFAESEMKALGIDKRPELVELLQPMSPAAQVEWLSKHRDSLKSSGGGLPSTPSDGKDSKISHEDRLKASANIRQYGA